MIFQLFKRTSMRKKDTEGNKRILKGEKKQKEKAGRERSVEQEMELWEKPEKTGKAKKRKEKNYGEAEKN